MTRMQEEGRNRDREVWQNLINQLNEAYKVEEEFWARKSRVDQLQNRDQNTKYFHAVTT